MKFETLDEYYAYLESDTNFSHLDFNTEKYITALRNKTEDEEVKKLCSFELYFADFIMEKGIQLPKFQVGGNSYPSLELFDDDFQYIKTRAENTENPKYKAKYNHLLWLSPQIHIDYAKEAIESYFSLLQNSSFSNQDNLLCRSFGKYFENLFVLSQTINYKKNEAVEYFVSLLETDKLNDFTKYSIMDFIVANGKKIDKSTIQTFYDYSKNAIENLESRVLESYLNLLVILSQKLGTSPSEFHEKLGDYHVSQIEIQKKESFVYSIFYSKALEEYRKAGNKSKIEETAVLLEQSKKKIDLKKVSVEMKDEEFNKALNLWWELIQTKTSVLVEKGDSKDIYESLTVEKLFTKSVEVKDETNMSILDLVSTYVFDINKNISKDKSRAFNPYFLQIKFSLQQIGLIFSKGIESGKISFESLMDYLKSKTWYRYDFTYEMPDGKIEGINWIDLLSPSLQAFFVQQEIDLKTSSHNSQGYVLAIDSLVLKFEGLLREFSRALGAQTIEIKENGTKERISFDKLLDNEKVKALIPEDDIAFFKFLFTSDGMDLRNNIAHSFYSTKNYSSEKMLLLIVALLRLGNFKIEPKKNNTSG